jgi:pescadillo protein
MKSLSSNLRGQALPAALPAPIEDSNDSTASPRPHLHCSEHSSSDREDDSEVEGSEPEASASDGDDGDLEIDSGEEEEGDGVKEEEEEEEYALHGAGDDAAGSSDSQTDVEDLSPQVAAESARAAGPVDSGEAGGAGLEEDSPGHDRPVATGGARDIEGGGVGAASGQGDGSVCSTLFQGLVVWLSREVPREVLMLIIRSFGGAVCWDGPGSPMAESDERITHAVVDRPAQGHVRLGRVYVQPQWVFDSANFAVLVPTARYGPGRKLPPHLSPFVDYSEEGYVPEYAAELMKLQEASAAVRQREAGRELEGGGAAFEAAAQEGEHAQKLVDGRDLEQEQQFLDELALELGALQLPGLCTAVTLLSIDLLRSINEVKGYKSFESCWIPRRIYPSNVILVHLVYKIVVCVCLEDPRLRERS